MHFLYVVVKNRGTDSSFSDVNTSIKCMNNTMEIRNTPSIQKEGLQIRNKWYYPTIKIETLEIHIINKHQNQCDFNNPFPEKHR